MQSSIKEKKSIKAAFILSLLILLLLFSGCGSSSGPVKLKDFSFYNSEFLYEKKVAKMYVSFTNKEKKMEIESLELTIKGKFGGKNEGEDSIRYRIALPYSLAPGDDWSFVYDIDGLLLNEKYKVSVSKVSFSNGTVWTSGKNPSAVTASVDGKKGKGMPASLEECNYYEQRSNSWYRDLNVLWLNTGDKPLRGVVYEIVAYDADGNQTTDRSGNKESLYFSSFDSQLTMPGDKQSAYHVSMTSKYYLLEDSSYIDVRIVKAIAEDGTVYTSKGDTLTAYFGSKKAYDFGNAKNKAVTKLGDSIRKAVRKEGIIVSKPLIYIREGDFAVLRFENFDVRVELTEKGKVSPYNVSIVSFATKDEYMANVNEEGIYIWEQSLAKAILPKVLTKIKEKEIQAKLDEYYHNDKWYVDFEDTSYDTFDSVSVIFSEDGDRLICSVFSVGRDFDYYPLNDMFWAYDSIYESEQNMTVNKRPQDQ
ncbi:MAG: hypothetical protein J5528_04780 [Firmicutes bacterium]|nr:hypothetical protein [Bacillota bacterium]